MKIVALVAALIIGLSGEVGLAQAQRLKVGDNIKPPAIIVKVNPTYPQEAQDRRIQGVVVLAIVIGEDGSVIDTEVRRSVPELDQAAVDAVLQWEYERTLLNGKPVEVEMDVTINFTLS
jgi:TonB family protein